MELKYFKSKQKIEEQICEKLKEIEEKENVIIIYAAEAGSRAWGIASKDSDFDVRFIYIRPREFYLQLEAAKDVIEWQLDEVFDVNGWDLKKALQQFYRFNMTLYEWINSPIIYQTTKIWKDIIQNCNDYFCAKAGLYHYYGIAKKTYLGYLQGESVNYKKYFYVLRPLLACEWILKQDSPPPVFFKQLLEQEIEKNIKEEIQKLLKIKQETTETFMGKKIELLDQYIEKKLVECQNIVKNKKKKKNLGWQFLNELFLKTLNCLSVKNVQIDSKKLQEFYEYYKGKKGANLEIIEYLCTVKRTIDRHVTSTNHILIDSFEILWRVSGARFMFFGEGIMDYEIGSDFITELEIIPDGYKIYEDFSNQTSRISVIRIKSESE